MKLASGWQPLCQPGVHFTGQVAEHVQHDAHAEQKRQHKHEKEAMKVSERKRFLERCVVQHVDAADVVEHLRQLRQAWHGVVVLRLRPRPAMVRSKRGIHVTI